MPRMLVWSATAALVALCSLVRGDEDDILDATNTDAEGYSATSCARYMCPKYKSEMRSYLQAGCEGSFGDYLPDDSSSSGEVTISAALIIAGCSFVGAFLAGVLLGRNFKPERAATDAEAEEEGRRGRRPLHDM